jgi:hypothetical protein
VYSEFTDNRQLTVLKTKRALPLAILDKVFFTFWNPGSFVA